MGEFHNTVESKLEFVKGEVTLDEPSEGYVACGEGSRFPILATPDEVAAVHYRVYDCRIGTKAEDVFSYDAMDSGRGIHNYDIKSNGVDPGPHFVENLWSSAGDYEENYSHRGVWGSSSPGVDNPYWTAALLDAHYSAGYTIYTVGGGPTTGLYHDLLEAEHHAWCTVPNPSLDPTLSGRPLYIPASAMSCYVMTQTYNQQTSQHGISLVDNYPGSPGVDGEVRVTVGIGRRVAYVNSDPNAGPFDAGSTLYLEVTATIQVINTGYVVWDDFSWIVVSTDKDDPWISSGMLSGDDVKKSSAFLVLRLTAGVDPVEVRCPFYMASFEGGTGFAGDAWGQLTVEATKFYPFDLGDGNPAWDDTTGKSL